MTYVNVEIGDALLMKALASAVAKKISFDAYLEEVLAEAEEKEDEPNGLTDLDSAIELALERAAKLQAGKEFQLQDLFSDPEWAGVVSPRWFGRKFRPAVEQAGIAQYINKTQTNKAIYRRS